MASVKYEPVPKGYKRLWLIAYDNDEMPSNVRASEREASGLVVASYGDRVMPIDVPLSALKPAKAKKK